MITFTPLASSELRLRIDLSKPTLWCAHHNLDRMGRPAPRTWRRDRTRPSRNRLLDLTFRGQSALGTGSRCMLSAFRGQHSEVPVGENVVDRHRDALLGVHRLGSGDRSKERRTACLRKPLRGFIVMQLPVRLL